MEELGQTGLNDCLSLSFMYCVCVCNCVLPYFNLSGKLSDKFQSTVLTWQ